MILSPSEIASAARWSAFWEFSEYASEAIVFLGCVGEYIAEYTEWRTEQVRHSLGKVSLVFLILGLGAGLFSLIKTNALAGILIVSLGEQAEQAADKAKQALESSSLAITQSKKAVGESGQAVTSASSALTTASGLKNDIKTARKEAADALANLAEAKRLAEEAQQGTARNTEKLADRTLSPLQQANIAARLRPLGPRRVDVIIIGDTGEIGAITDLIDSAIRQGGWTVNLVGKAISGPNVSGVFVGTHIGSDQGVINAQDALVTALQSVGIATRRFVPQFDDKLPMAIMGSWDEKNVAPIRMLVSAKP